MKQNLNSSPCFSCTSVRDPENCENKNCLRWRNWFIEKWENLRKDPRLTMERRNPGPEGIMIGGIPYVLPDQIQTYLKRNPCQHCACARYECDPPCPTRRTWDGVRKEVAQ